MAPKNIWIAAGDGLLDRVRELVEIDQVSVDAKDENGYTPLHAAASYGQPAIVEYLVGAGAETDITDNDGDTPLHACESVECAQILIAHGANMTAQNHDGAKPFETAQDNDALDVANLIRHKLGMAPVELRPEDKDVQPWVEDDEDATASDATSPPQQGSALANALNGDHPPSDDELRELATQMVLDELMKQANGKP
ncbi:hypothetical protein H4R35_003143 [Dimargaris xerosporica]|nr:hypothetical protein H4R35_003143 [Dimargaris xerosporica]